MNWKSSAHTQTHNKKDLAWLTSPVLIIIKIHVQKSGFPRQRDRSPDYNQQFKGEGLL